MKRIWPFLRPLAAASAILVAAFLLAACDVDSVDSTTAVASDNTGTIYNYSGLYMHPENTGGTNEFRPLVYPVESQSGTPVTWLRLMQYGSVLEGFDNANQNWNGRISSIVSGTANFSLQGRTTAGTSVDISGTMSYADQKSRINATWIEPAASASFFAEATVTPATTNTPPAQQITISPPSRTLGPGNTTVQLTASGGTPPYNWRVSNSSLGSVTTTTVTTVNYTSSQAVGTNTVTVTDSAGAQGRSVISYVSAATNPPVMGTPSVPASFAIQP